MAIPSKLGNLVKQVVSSNASIYQVIRCMSSSKLFVGGLPYATDDQSLREAFTGFGEVVEARVITDRETGRSRGFGFVTFTSNEDASSAISGMDGKDIQGRIVRVNYANDRTRGFRGGYGSGFYSGGGYNVGGTGGYNPGADGGYNVGGSGGYNVGGSGGYNPGADGGYSVGGRGGYNPGADGGYNVGGSGGYDVGRGGGGDGNYNAAAGAYVGSGVGGYSGRYRSENYGSSGGFAVQGVEYGDGSGRENYDAGGGDGYFSTTGNEKIGSDFTDEKNYIDSDKSVGKQDSAGGVSNEDVFFDGDEKLDDEPIDPASKRS